MCQVLLNRGMKIDYIWCCCRQHNTIHQTPYLFSHSPLRLIIRFTAMLRIMFSLGCCKWIICLVLFGICVPIQSIEVGDAAVVDPQPSTTVIEQTKTDLPKTSSLTKKSYNFADIYKIELHLDTPGNIKIVAIDSNVEVQDTISVTLEKRVLTENPILTNTYIDNITLISTQKDGVLQLNSQFPKDTPNKTSEETDISSIQKDLQLNYEIETPQDVSVDLRIKVGDIFLHHLRGKIQVINELGNVHLDETIGNYQVETYSGRIHGQILLATGQNVIKTQRGSIDLSVLDDLAAPLDITASDGNIRLLLPNNYPADVELNSEKRQYLINLPSEIEDNIGIINEGGPLLRLTATDTISILSNPRLKNISDETEKEGEQEIPSSDVELSIPYITQPPTIDGNLSEMSWLYSKTLSAFQNPAGTEPAENQTDVYLLYDADNFYIGVRAFIQSSQVPRVSQTQLDSPIWEDESIEILLDMDPKTEAYSHLIINPIGGVFDQMVTQVGYPSFRFAPRGVQRETPDKSVVQFKADSSWNSNAKVSTTISTNYWSIEAAIPRKTKGKDGTATWLFNVYRNSQFKKDIDNVMNPVVHREYSYWLPMYDEEYPWWPHWKEGMGKLKLTGKQHFFDSFDVRDSFIVSAIDIEGNKIIPNDVLLEKIPITIGATLTNEQLTRLFSELENWDWFEKVELKTAVRESDETNSTPDLDGTDNVNIAKNKSVLENGLLKVSVQISVTETQVQFADKTKIRGNRSFPELFIKRWFDLFPGYYHVENMKLKQQMIRDFYLNRGFSFAKVTHEYANALLQYNINEGNLDDIRFTGNRRIPDTILSAALDLDTEAVYFHSLGQSKINNLQKELKKNNDAFKSIGDWQAQKEGGKNVLIIDIIEHPLVKSGWFPIIGFNRIHGPVLGAGGNLSTHLLNEEHLFGSISMGVSSRILNYQVGVENTFFTRSPLSIGIGSFKLTNKSINEIRLLPAEFNLSDSFYGTSVDHFYQSRGEHIWIAKKFGKSSQFRLEYTHENHDNLFKSTDWSYYNRGKVKLGNHRIETGSQNIVSLRYTFDTRDHKSTLSGADNLASQMILRPNPYTRKGWRGNFGIEIVGGRLGGDWTYNIYHFELIRYTPLVGKHNLNVRFLGDFSDARLPTQQLLYLGGLPNLRGYRHNIHAGDKRFVLNVEHRLANIGYIKGYSDVSIGWALSTFLDIGQVWWYDENPFNNFSLQDLKLSMGIGFSLFLNPPGFNIPLNSVFEFAIPLNVKASQRKLVVIWRLEQMF